jgi:hypothetical protein
MKLVKYLSIGLLTLALLILCDPFGQAQAYYYSGLENSDIKITNPNKSIISCNDSLLIEGSSNLDLIWFAIRGPQEELNLWKAEVIDGTFSTTINLRFGSGIYTIWAGANPQRFDGSIRFLVDNQSSSDNRYLTPSIYVDCQQAEIIQLAATIAPAGMSAKEKVKNIHSWITQNIEYDYEAYLNQDVDLHQASQVLKDGKGLCRDYAFLFAALAAITIVVGNLIALAQRDVKRLLAYSSIAQAGYILVGATAANSYGLKGVLFYAMIYVFANVGAFAVATAVEVDSGRTDIEAFAGLSKRSPLMAAIMTICMLSLAGIPPMAGFAGKFYLFAGAIQAGYLWLALLGLVMSMVSVYYYLGVSKAMYIGENMDEAPLTPGWGSTAALWVCVLATLILGVYPGPLSELAGYAIQIFM